MVTFELKVVRSEYGDTYTMGKFLVEGMIFGDTIEPPSRHLSSNMSIKEIQAKKVYGKTAIPTGRYKLELRVSPSLKDKYYAKPFGGKFPYLVDVPCWKDVMIHPFNYGHESKGCISVGEYFKSGAIMRAAEGYQVLMNTYLMKAFERGQEVYLTIEEK